MQNHTESVYLKLALTYIYKNNNKNDCLYVHLAIKDNVKKSYYKTNGLKYIKKKKKQKQIWKIYIQLPSLVLA
jgi:hypothetical protein